MPTASRPSRGTSRRDGGARPWPRIRAAGAMTGVAPAAAGGRWTRLGGEAGRRPSRLEPLPAGLVAFVIRTGLGHQGGLAAMSTLLFVLGVVPLALQRRIVDLAVGRASIPTVLACAALYLGVVLGEGLLKLGLNVYRAWVGEVAARWLRLWALAAIGAVCDGAVPKGRAAEAVSPPADGGTPEIVGIGIAILIAEAEPIGAFVGASVSEPLLKAGLLLSVFGYLTWLQPLLGLLGLAVLLPQGVLVPLMQRAINRRIGARVLELRHVSGSIAALGPTGTRGVAERVERVLELNLSLFGLKFSMNFLMNAFQHLGVTAVLAVGGILVASGHTDIGTVVAFISGLAKVNDPWGDLIDWFRDFYATRAKYDLILRSSLAQAQRSALG